MEIEIYSAIVSAGIAPDKAKEAVDSISREIDKRYALHSQQLATHGDIEGVRKEVADVKTSVAEMENRLLRAMADMQRWTISSLFAAVGLFAVISKLWH
jgi:uncharacterized coiled-coil DUF342 family protein